jgi:hypothetical protein
VLRLQQRPNPGYEKPAEEYQNEKANKYQCKETCEFHDGPWGIYSNLSAYSRISLSLRIWVARMERSSRGALK